MPHAVLAALVSIVVCFNVSMVGPQTRPARLERIEHLQNSATVRRSCRPDSGIEIALAPQQSGRLLFEENDAGVTEILFWFDGIRIEVWYGCGGVDWSSTFLTQSRRKDNRIISAGDSTGLLDCTTEWLDRDKSATVRFQSKHVAREEVERRNAERTQRHLREMRKTLSPNTDRESPPIEILMDDPDHPKLAEMRSRYKLDDVVAGASDDYERLRRIVKWTHDRWKHSGDNVPSQPDPLTILDEAAAGKRFRGVEYARVAAACARALGMPSRVLCLKRADVETAQSGAGHLVAEVWLEPQKKWVLADAQWDVIPECDGLPLNAVEFQAAFARNDPGLTLRTSSDLKPVSYLRWVIPYLYYFDFNLDQRFFVTPAATTHEAETQRRSPGTGQIMLVPAGVPEPTVFQQKDPIRNCRYISDPKAFYPAMYAPTALPGLRAGEVARQEEGRDGRPEGGEKAGDRHANFRADQPAADVQVRQACEHELGRPSDQISHHKTVSRPQLPHGREHYTPVHMSENPPLPSLTGGPTSGTIGRQ